MRFARMIRPRPPAGTLIPGILAAATLIIIASWLTIRHADQELRGNLLQQARLVAQAVNIENVKTLTGTSEDLRSPQYQQLKEQLTSIRSANSQCRFVYIMGQRTNGTVFFLVDSESVSSTDYSPPGQPLENASAEFLRMFNTKAALAEGPITDRWGTWISGLVPLIDPKTGSMPAVLGMDIDARLWGWVVLSKAALPVGLILMLCIGSATAFLSTRRGKSIPKPVLRHLLLPLTIIILLLMGGAAILLIQQHRKQIAREIRANSANLSDNLGVLLDQQNITLRTTLLPIAASTSVQKALREGDTNTLLATWRPVYKALRNETGISHFSFFNTNRVCLLRVHSPKKRGDINIRPSALEAELTHKTASTTKLGSLGEFVLRVVQPVFESGNLVGYVELGMELNDAFHALHLQSGNHIAVSLRKNRLDQKQWEDEKRSHGLTNDWNYLPKSILVYTSLGRLPKPLERLVADHDSTDITIDGGLEHQVDFDDKNWGVSLSPLLDTDGNEVGVLFVIRDITAEKVSFSRLLTVSGTISMLLLMLSLSIIYLLLRRTDAGIRSQQTLLRESEEKYRLLIENSHDIIYMLSAEGLITFVSPAWTLLLGHPTEQIVGKHFPQLVHHDDIPNCKKWLQKVIETENRQDGVEYRIQHIDGTWRWHTSSAVAVRNADGTIIGFEGTARDITKRKQDEEQIQSLLEESHQARLALLSILEDQTRSEADRKRLAMAIEQATEVIVITDTQGLIQYVNPAFETVTGYTHEEAIGQSLRLISSGQHDSEFYRELWETLRSGIPWQGRFINKRKNGMLYTEEATISPVRDSTGNIINYVAVKRDITEHLNLHMQLSQAQKMESIGRLAGGMAHDFNNMLMAIIGYTDLCRDELPESHPGRCYLDEITRASRRSADLTRQLLAFARRQTIAPIILNLNETVTDMLKLLRRIIGEDINLKWLPGPELWPVKLDPSQLDQLTTNLCVNARDAISGVGHITIETANATIDQEFCANHTGLIPGDFVLMKVSDNGCGMEKEVRDHIFEPFFTTKDVGEGTGLGLATVYGIVKQNNGFIYCDSEVGKGTVFTIYLPRSQEKSTPPSARNTDETPMGRGETVLLVEDEEMPRKICSRFLNSLGYATLVAETPESAQIIATQHSGKIHLLLTDVIMPGMNGRDLAKKLMANDQHMKCLFMSGYTSDIIANQGLLGKDLQFIPKPFSRNDLARKMREALDAPRPNVI